METKVTVGSEGRVEKSPFRLRGLQRNLSTRREGKEGSLRRKGWRSYPTAARKKKQCSLSHRCQIRRNGRRGVSAGKKILERHFDRPDRRFAHGPPGCRKKRKTKQKKKGEKVTGKRIFYGSVSGRARRGQKAAQPTHTCHSGLGWTRCAPVHRGGVWLLEEE